MKKLFLLLLIISQSAFAVTANKLWRIPSGGTLPGWGPANLADGTNAVTGILAFGNGGTGSSSITGLVSSAVNLKTIRGGGSSAPSGGSCGTAIGEGYSCIRSGTGDLQVTFTSAFSDTPACVCSGWSAPCVINLVHSSPSTSFVGFQLSNYAGSGIDISWSFVCVGGR
jgi:hypothetical protein